MPILSQKHGLLPVTAVAFDVTGSRNRLLVGEGSYLHLLDVNQPSLSFPHRTKLFEKQTIHGITVCLDNILTGPRCLIWGGCSISLVALQKDNTCVALSKETTLKDRILDVCFLSCRDGIQAAVLTAHDKLLLLHFRPVSRTDPLLRACPTELASGPSSVLYSAHLIYKDDQVVVAAGTVFGEIILWTCRVLTSEPNRSAEARVIQSFAGHEGSIFGIRISDGCSNSRRMLLVSCSDDRTIKIWDIATAIQAADQPHHPVEGQETGFLRPLQVTDKSLASAMGHSSRVWISRCLSSSHDCAQIISFGEDTTARLWDFRTTTMAGPSMSHATESHRLQAGVSLAFHSGKNIWAVDVCRRRDGSHHVVTGGADGRIVSYTVLSDDGNGQHRANRLLSQQSTLNRLSSNEDCQMQGYKAVGTEALFTAIQGVWVVHREIKSTIPFQPIQIFKGRAVLEARPATDPEYDAELLYTETGHLHTDTGLELECSRRYIYRYQTSTDSITVWFVQAVDGTSVDHLFHRIAFGEHDDHSDFRPSIEKTTIAQGYHLCIDDHYNAQYMFIRHGLSLRSWSVKYVVHGPKKDYFTDTVYERETAPGTKMEHDKAQTDLARADVRAEQPSDSFKMYCWIGAKRVLAITSQGRLLQGEIDDCSLEDTNDISTIAWAFILQSDDLISCNVLTAIDNIGALMGGAGGVVYLYYKSSHVARAIARLPRKISYLYGRIISSPTDAQSFHIGLVVYCLGMQNAYCLSLDPSCPDDPLVHQVILPSTFVVTSACIIDQGRVLALGSRSGAVCFYNRSTFPSEAKADSILCTRYMHGHDAVASIHELPSEGSVNGRHHILTTGRDGRFAVHCVDIPEGPEMQIEVQTVHESAPPFGPNIEGAHFDKFTGELLLWGFRSKDFVVWNYKKQQEVMKVECGGAHRSWAFRPADDGRDGGALIWTKASTCNVYARAMASHKVLQSGGHGREVKAMAIWRDQSKDNKKTLIATGAEDTNIRMFTCSSNVEGEIGLESHAILSKHSAGLQHLAWSDDGRYLFSAGGREELHVWHVQAVPCIKLGVVCIARCPAVTEEEDLRIMDFHVESIAPKTTSSGDFLISIAYSDSSIRIYSFSTKTTRFELLGVGTYTNVCLTCISPLRLLSGTHLLVASTDGHLALFTAPGDKAASTQPAKLRLLLRHRIHQNTIKALIIQRLSPVEILVITGGDDNALGLTRLTAPSPSRPNERPPLPALGTASILIPRAHASAISALQILPGAHVERPGAVHSFRLVSASSDQSLKTWAVSVDTEKPGVEGVEVRKDGSRWSEVADVACMEAMGTGVVLAGVGMEVWSVDDG